MKNIAFTLGWIAILKHLYRICIVLTLISAFLVPYPLITALTLVIPPMILTWMIPLNLGTQQSSFRAMFYWFGGTILFSIMVYAYIYFKHGLYVSGAPFDVGFFDALYFSITTWTTLGYGDFSPTPGCRLVSSIEALTGYFSMAIFIVLTGLFVTEGKKTIQCWFSKGNNKKDKTE